MESNRVFKKCQSCGMPLKRDKLGGGTNTDGTQSRVYCSHCFASGRFTMPDLTVDQMRERVQKKLKQFGFPAFLARFLARDLDQLQRWKSDRTG